VLISEGDRAAPEINQISIVGNPSQEFVDLLQDAVMYLAFVRIPGNKPNSDSSTRSDIYMIHPIYAPYFVFGYRRKRKMEISESQFMGMISDSKKNINAILKEKKIFIDDSQELPEQLMLFKEFYEHD
jgi:hypothetical protein